MISIKFPGTLAVFMCSLILLILQINVLSAQESDPLNQLSRRLSGLTILNAEEEFATPKFTAPIRIKANGVDMKVDTYTSVPCVVDWNQDGKKDLLVGSFFYGNVYFFNNSGTNTIPVFTSGVKLKSGGVDISVAYG